MIRNSLLLVLLTLTSHAANPHVKLVRSISESTDQYYSTTVDTTFTYDGTKLLSSVRIEKLSISPLMSFRTVTTFTYEDDKLITQVVESDIPEARWPVLERLTTTYLYDDRGRLIEQSTAHDEGGDGFVDFFTRRRYSLDGQGRTVRTTFEYLAPDTPQDHPLKSEIIYTYDSHDNVLLEQERYDLRIDGVIDGTRTSRYAYDARENVTDVATEYDFGVDGVVDLTEARNYSYSYGHRGQVLSLTTSIIGGPYGSSVTKTSYAYDVHGNVIRVVDELDSGSEGVVDAVSTTVYTYSRTRRARGDNGQPPKGKASNFEMPFLSDNEWPP